MKLEEKLVSLRKAKGLPQLKLAEMMNVSRQAISRWERGTAVPSTDNLRCLGDLYGISVDVFLNDAVELPLQEQGRNATRKAFHGENKKHIKIIVAIYIILLVLVAVVSWENWRNPDYGTVPALSAIICIGCILAIIGEVIRCVLNRRE